jgi:Flp pilus assembly protein TadD
LRTRKQSVPAVQDTSKPMVVLPETANNEGTTPPKKDPTPGSSVAANNVPDTQGNQPKDSVPESVPTPEAKETNSKATEPLANQGSKDVPESASQEDVIKKFRKDTHTAMRQRKVKTAAKLAEEWAKVDPSPEPKIMQARALSRSGKRKEAREILAKVVEEHPDNKEALKLLGITKSKVAKRNRPKRRRHVKQEL